MSLLPNRRTLRTRWSTLLWAGGICFFAMLFAYQPREPLLDAANASESNASQASALLAEDDE